MQKNIAIVMGGYSSEINISLKSGDVVYNSLDKNKYNVYKVFILKEKWFVVVDGSEFHINRDDFSVTVFDRKIIFDCVFNAIHGHPGENGVLIAYFDLLGIKIDVLTKFLTI